MTMRPNEFSHATQQLALARQKFKCGSCGTRITHLGNAGRAAHQFGEGAQAHHVRHVKFGGTAALDNCVILCSSCHYSAHEGGNYRWGTVIGKQSDFPHFRG
jgi:5-methylcytosine-specific restriction endonuclease McrA